MTSVPSRMRRVSRASPASVIHASVGPGQAISLADDQIVVGSEEGVEAEPLGSARDRELIVVGRALLGFDEDTKLHCAIVGSGHVLHVVSALTPRPWAPVT